MKECCKNCHFLVKFKQDADGGVSGYNWDDDEKEAGEYGTNYVGAGCWRGIWNTEYTPELKDKISIQINTKRKGKCFFYRYQIGMLQDTAVIIHQRIMDLRSVKQSNLNSTIGLVLTAIALCFNASVTLYSATHIDTKPVIEVNRNEKTPR